MKVTSTRVRVIGGDGVYAIASITIDDVLIINDIKVERHGNEIIVKMPRTETAKHNNQYSVYFSDEQLYKEIKAKIIAKLIELS